MSSNFLKTISLILSLAAAIAAEAATTPTAYEVIQSYDFPVGILPVGVTHYELDESSGRFNAYMEGPCSFSLEGSYQLNYDSRISGYIHKGRLTELSGVSVKVLFLWFNIVDVRRNGDNLKFSVGIGSAEFGMDNFNVCPRCGCGLNCDDGDTKRVSLKRRNHFVSSI